VPAKRFAGEHLEVAPVHGAQAINSGKRIEPLSAPCATQEGNKGSDPATDQQHPAQRGEDAGRGRPAEPGQVRIAGRTEIPAKAVADR
jgi:hypothetical protein